MPLDLDEHITRAGLQLSDELVEPRFRGLGQIGPTEPEVALILRQGYFVYEAAARVDNLVAALRNRVPRLQISNAISTATRSREGRRS